MLEGINPLLTGELLLHLDRMGHSDSVVVADAHFPAWALGERVIDLPGTTTPEVVAAIRQLPEQQLFMKGVLSWVGFRTEIIEYDRPPRVAGNSKFSVWRLWNLALDGITSFSTVPLRLWTYVGGGVSLFAFAFAVYMVVDKLLWGTDVPGYPSLMTAILFLGGVQLIGIGILGEYIGRIYQETKHRPRYVVRKVVGRRRKIR